MSTGTPSGSGGSGATGGGGAGGSGGSGATGGGGGQGGGGAGGGMTAGVLEIVVVGQTDSTNLPGALNNYLGGQLDVESRRRRRRA